MDLAKASVPPVVAEKRTNRFLPFRQLLHSMQCRDDAIWKTVQKTPHAISHTQTAGQRERSAYVRF